MLINFFNLIVGDACHYGHRKIQNVLVSSTLDWEKLHSAYVKGAKKLKFDI